MMNRRWFFTAAGSAFAAAACTTVRGDRDAPPSVPDPMPQGRDSQRTALLASFYEGLERERDRMRTKFDVTPEQFPSNRAGLEAIFDERLDAIYGDRFDWRRQHEEDWTPRVFREAMNQACILGQLTALAFAYHTGAAGDQVRYSFDEQKPGATLDVKHLDWARDMYGFYTNIRYKKRDRRHFLPLELCHVVTPDPGREINEPCPFCAG